MMQMQEKHTAEWLRNEHKILTELLTSLSAHSAAIPDSGREDWLQHLVQMVSRLKIHLKKHMAAEEEDDGFLAPVMQRRPTLSREVEHLRHEHRELQTLLEQIHDEARNLKPDDTLLIEDTCHRLQHFMSAVRHHEEHEELLVTFVFSQDIGTKD